MIPPRSRHILLLTAPAVRSPSPSRQRTVHTPPSAITPCPIPETVTATTRKRRGRCKSTAPYSTSPEASSEYWPCSSSGGCSYDRGIHLRRRRRDREPRQIAEGREVLHPRCLRGERQGEVRGCHKETRTFGRSQVQYTRRTP